MAQSVMGAPGSNLSQLSTGLLLPDAVHRILEEGQVCRTQCVLDRGAVHFFLPRLSPRRRWPQPGAQNSHTCMCLWFLLMQALRWDIATSCYEVVDGEMFERRFDELRRKRDRDDGSNGRPFSRMHKYYKLQSGERWAKTVSVCFVVRLVRCPPAGVACCGC